MSCVPDRGPDPRTAFDPVAGAISNGLLKFSRR
jgi:hypothetical protein